VCRISKKMILLPFQQFFVVFPQLHSYWFNSTTNLFLISSWLQLLWLWDFCLD
jgi:hypothetical protein